jgi:hypothetical protein
MGVSLRIHPLLTVCVSNMVLMIEWIKATTKNTKPDPPKPDEIEEGNLRSKVGRYTEFADRMIRAVHGKSRYGTSSTTILLDDLVSPSQEAFTLLLYRNGYDNWVWRHNHASVSSEGSYDSNVTCEGDGEEDEDGCPKYEYTKNTTGNFTSRNGGWSRDGMKKYNTLYKKVKDDRMMDAGAFSEVYKVHREQLSGKKRKRRKNDGDRRRLLTISNDLGELLTDLDSNGDDTSGSVAVPV